MAPAATSTVSVPTRTARIIGAVCMECPSVPEYACRAVFFADRSLQELIFLSIDRTRHSSSKCSLVGSVSQGARALAFFIPESSHGQQVSVYEYTFRTCERTQNPDIVLFDSYNFNGTTTAIFFSTLPRPGCRDETASYGYYH